MKLHFITLSQHLTTINETYKPIMNIPQQPEALQLFVYYTFIISLFSMTAGSVFFFAQQSRMPESYRSSAIISGVICLLAAMTYFMMKDIYYASITSGVATRFPTELRYIDWILTVPLMLIKFPTLLGVGQKGQRFMTLLIIASLIMLVTAFTGEVNFGNKAYYFGFYAVSVTAWLYILFSLNKALGSLPASISEEKKATIKKMFILILIGWVIYPIGYLLPIFQLEPDYRELVYNIGDVINKVGLGLIIIAGGFRDKKETIG